MAGPTVPQEFLKAENVGLRLLLEQAGIDARALLAQSGIEAKERETAERLQKLILEELHHRIKNTLATVSAIASQSLRTADSLEHAQQAIEGRLQALGRAHDLLLQARWSSASLAHIVQGATEPYDSKGEGKFSIQGPDLKITSGAVIALAMTLNELCTNTTKFGALSVPSGRIEIAWTIDEHGQRLRLTVPKLEEAPMLDKSPRPAAVNVPNDLAAHWMPFTANRAFKKAPRLLAGAKDMHYFTVDGRKIIDAAAGMWCCNAGHGRTQISSAIAKQAEALDYAPPFQFGIPQAFELASRIADLAPAGLDHVFFCNSGSEAADTALKIALAYHQIQGQGSRTRLIGRERGYHGVGFGGTSVGGIVNNRKMFGTLLAGVDHLPHTYDRDKQAFTKGEPEYGAHFADELERLVNLHGASTIAAVMVEPMAGSTGVLPPPKGYLKRLREITQKHGILLIFDEVITGYGRLGFAFAAERYGVLPDMLTFAKGITNGAAPMGGVLVRDTIHDAFMTGPEHAVELTHGYTYSAHPLACAAALATLDIYRDEKLFERAKKLEPKFADAVMSLKGEPNVVDIRTIGLTAGIDLAPRPDLPGKRGFDGLNSAFHDNDLMLRVAGDTLALTPPLIVSEDQIGEIIEKVAKVIRAVA
jgi:beta-alanine--pyruvate transaminase